MGKKARFIVLWVIFFGIGAFLVTLFEAKLSGTIIDSILIGIGFLILIGVPYFVFRSKKPFLFIIFGLGLPFGAYFFVESFLLHRYPLLSLVLLITFVMLGVLFTFLLIWSLIK